MLPQQTIRYTTSADGTQIAVAILPLLRAAHQVTRVKLDCSRPLWRPGFHQFDARPYLKDVQAPTLVIRARNDILHPVTEGRTLAAGIPGAEFMVVESANTLCLSPDPTCPAQVEAILAFLAKDADIGGDLVGT